jgi:hypothetical protein
MLIATINFGYSTTKQLIIHGSEPLPFQWILQPYDNGLCPVVSYVMNRPVKDMPSAPPEDTSLQEFSDQHHRWAAKLGGVDADMAFSLTLQGRSAEIVILRDLRVVIVDRRPPLKGNVYTMGIGCGGEFVPRRFSVNLDKLRPSVRAVKGYDYSGKVLPPVTFPYRISESDPEIFFIAVQTVRCNCKWYLDLDWSSGSRTGTARIDDRGQPFHTTSEKGLPKYLFDSIERKWRPYQP